ncbi:uncharacterized protein LOC130754733 [Actinidia eriantha]|uniref:uncharacterized protein LOC130754733 n=1 Tax=Actinidia eriantha TaxID=165200 RepID=UPI00258E961B|nr:uncharacterized protein LOC130754733 [Actinidia eriantha]
MPMPRIEVMNCTTIKQFQQLNLLTFHGTPNPMAAKSWLLSIERVFEVLLCTEEQKVIFATFSFEGAALVWWQLTKPLEPLWLWLRFLEVFNEKYFSEMVKDQKIIEYNAKFMELCRYAPHIVSTESQNARKFEAELRWNIHNKVDILRLPTHQKVLQRAIIAERSLNEMSQYRESIKKKLRGGLSGGQISKRQSLGSSSENSLTPRENIVSQGSIMYNEVPTCPNYRRKHWGECRFGSKVCYKCGQEGHQAKDYPRWNRAQGTRMSALASTQQPLVARRDNQLRQGQAFALISENTPATTSVMPGIPLVIVSLYACPY